MEVARTLANTHAENTSNTANGIGEGIISVTKEAGIDPNFVDGGNYPSDDSFPGATRDTDALEGYSYNFDTVGDIYEWNSPGIDDPSLHNLLNQDIDPGYPVDGQSWFESFDTGLGGFDSFPDSGGGLGGFDGGGSWSYDG
jgi:hypothetical protein